MTFASSPPGRSQEGLKVASHSRGGSGDRRDMRALKPKPFRDYQKLSGMQWGTPRLTGGVVFAFELGDFEKGLLPKP